MAVGVILEVPGGTQHQYEEITASAFPDGKLPDGWAVHIAGPTETGWRVINVVRSGEEFEAFARDTLAPAAADAGDPAPVTTFFAIYKLIRG